MLDNLISPHQMAFISGRWIGENTILASEFVHTMKKRRKGNAFMGFKIDLMKAYDRVDLVFSQESCPILGFLINW